MVKRKIFISLFFLLMVSLPAISQIVESTPKAGKKELSYFVKQHIDYPDKALKNNIEGTVIIDFFTNTEGEVTNYFISEKVSPCIDSTAISLFRKVLWLPATNYGKPISYKSEFSIKFKKKQFNKIANRRGYFHINQPEFPIDTSYKLYEPKELDTIPQAIIPDNSKSILQYIYKKLIYPEAASRLGIKGEVQLSFIIESNGLISNLLPTKTLGGGCTEEAIKKIKLIKWEPGVYKKKSVRTKYIINIHFNKTDNRENQIPNQQGYGI